MTALDCLLPWLSDFGSAFLATEQLGKSTAKSCASSQAQQCAATRAATLQELCHLGYVWV